ncbi:MAG: SBBP repeat-containing protein [Bryobacterales bacterium]|nr:SBBP repeat-containing protein [Bryobacterales bacterium]MBV9400921.1 SBBP repeat-containing protein [Bryobacterales bacterium]
MSALNSTGTALLYSTYLGGSVSGGGNPGSDIASAIAWDSLDNAVYVVGTAINSDFPTTPGAFQNKNPSGLYLPFVAKFSATGQLTKSTFLGAGGAGYEYGLGVAADSLGQAYIVGYTSYSHCTPQSVQNCFPTTPGAVIPGSNVAGDSNFGNGFVSVLNPSLSTLLYSTLLGDPNGASNGYGSEAFGVTVDPNGNFYVVGQTGAATLPVNSGAFQKTLAPSNGVPVVGFAAKFGPVSAKGASLLYLTYLEAAGLSFGDIATGVAADSQGNAYIGGYTHSPAFPATSSAIQNVCDPNSFLYNCAFVVKLNPTGTGLVWSTFVEPASFLTAIQLDTQGNVYVAGNNNGFFQAVNAVEPSLNQGGAFVAKINPAGSALLFSSLMGGTDGTGSLAVTGLAVDAPGNIYIAGYDRDTTLPTTPGAFQTALKNPGTGNSYDGYIGKISFPGVTITEVANAEGEAPTIAPNTWVSIKGTNLAKAGDSRIWQGSDFVNGQMPTQLDGVSVTVNGKPAYVYYISPSQVNILTPPDALTGSVNVVVTNNAVSSAPYLAQTQPESPSFVVFNGGPYIAAVHANGSLIGPATLYPGASTPAQPGETIVIYANGFGPTSTPVVSGSSLQSGSLSPAPVIDMGGIAATVAFAGLVAPGEFQFNVVVPSTLADGDQPVTATYNGFTTQAGTLLTVHQ